MPAEYTYDYAIIRVVPRVDRGEQINVGVILSCADTDFLDARIEVDESLLRAMQATSSDFEHWELHSEEMGFEDEFSLTSDDVANMADEWKLAYIARLLRSLALAFGVGTEFGDRVLVAEHYPSSPAALLRGLNDIACMPLMKLP